jgi:hypothetical protein
MKCVCCNQYIDSIDLAFTCANNHHFCEWCYAPDFSQKTLLEIQAEMTPVLALIPDLYKDSENWDIESWRLEYDNFKHEQLAITAEECSVCNLTFIPDELLIKVLCLSFRLDESMVKKQLKVDFDTLDNLQTYFKM